MKKRKHKETKEKKEKKEENEENEENEEKSRKKKRKQKNHETEESLVTLELQEPANPENESISPVDVRNPSDSMNEDNNVINEVSNEFNAAPESSESFIPHAKFHKNSKLSKPLKVNKKSNDGLPDWLAHPIQVPHIMDKSDITSISNPSFYLSPRIQRLLKGNGIHHLFPVQSAVLSKLLHPSSSSRPPRDLCVSAPTGSGKTLAYVLPIIETLSSRVIIRLRALIVLPTRELVTQVRQEFEKFARGTDLRIGSATGQTSFAKEQAAIMENLESKIDILVSTPGRLADHLSSSNGFTLQHLRFFVIDEADRLLSQSFQEWLPKVLQAENGIYGGNLLKKTSQSYTDNDRYTEMAKNMLNSYSAHIKSLNIIPLDNEELRMNVARTLRSSAYANFLPPGFERSPLTGHAGCVPIQKLLFSATLTRNPSKIASLQLFEPLYLAVSSLPIKDSAEELPQNSLNGLLDSTLPLTRFSLPPSLKQYYISCNDATRKPLLLMHLLYNLNLKRVLIFTKSVEAASRLCFLLKLHAESFQDESSLQPNEIEYFSSELSISSRKKLLNQFENGRVQVLISSDALARGLDLEGAINVVVNYDAPTRYKTYIHRVGRTARAGREGEAWTILDGVEAGYFKELMRNNGNNGIKRKNAGDSINKFMSSYENALAQLKNKFSGRAAKLYDMENTKEETESVSSSTEEET